jgi:hypothetical protein
MTLPLSEPEKLTDKVFVFPLPVEVRCSLQARLPGVPVSTHMNPTGPQQAGPELVQLDGPDTEIEFSVMST